LSEQQTLVVAELLEKFLVEVLPSSVKKTQNLI
jgi:hypothetical protein